jgi:hypothetical protein
VIGKIVLVEDDVPRTQVVPDPGHGLVATGHEDAAKPASATPTHGARRAGTLPTIVSGTGSTVVSGTGSTVGPGPGEEGAAIGPSDDQ